MQKILFLVLTFSLAQSVFGQDIGMYVFTRSPQLVNYDFENSKSSFNQGVSTGIGLTHKKLFLELGTFILDSDNYGYYSFFGSTVNSKELENSIYLNTNVFGEVTIIPSQAEEPESS